MYFKIVNHTVLVNNRRWNDETNRSFVWLCGVKKTSRNISFVSIHNSLYTQCIGAPIKKNIFFFQTVFFSNIFLKSHRFCCFFFPLQKAKKSSVQQTSDNRTWAASQHLGRSHSFHLWSTNQNLIKKTRAAACCYLEHYVTQTAFHI